MPKKGDLSKSGAGHKAHVVIESGSGIECVNAPIARDVKRVVVVAKVACWVAPRSNRVPLTVEARLRAKGSIFGEELTAIVGIQDKPEVGMSDVTARGIPGLK